MIRTILMTLSMSLLLNTVAFSNQTNFKKFYSIEQNGKKYKIYSASQVIRELQAIPKAIITFVGYSGKGYERENLLLVRARQQLKNYSPRHTIVNIGVTPDGIGKVYELAKSMGFETSGIVSKKALPYLDGVKDVDRIFLVEDESWGGYDENKNLNPTSLAMVSVSDIMIGIGGGDVGYAELKEAINQKVPVQFFRAEMNKAKARAKAKKKGKPAPTTFYGAADKIYGELY